MLCGWEDWGPGKDINIDKVFHYKEVETTLVRVRARQALCWQCVAVGDLLPHGGHRVAASVAGWEIVTTTTTLVTSSTTLVASSTSLVTSPTTLTTIAVPVAQGR